jgi:hypothetical protein
MKGLRASHFRRIHKGLLLDLILTVAGPAVFLLLAALLEKQMSAAGMATAEITADTALNFQSIYSKLLSAYLVLRYCASALCVMLIVSGLGEMQDCSPAFGLSRKWFIALMVINAVAMAARIASVLVQTADLSEMTDALYLISEGILLVIRGIAISAMLRGNSDVLGSIGAETEAHRACFLAKQSMIWFPAVGIIRLADHYIPPMSDVVNLIAFVLFAAVLICQFVLCIRIVIFSGKAAKMIAAISEEDAA